MSLCHRGISLNILSYFLVFLDIFYFEYLHYFSILLCFLFLKSSIYFDQCVVEWSVVLSSVFFSFNLRNYIFQSAKNCEMTSFSMTSLHVDLNEAARCVEIIPLTFASLLIAPSHTGTKYKMATIFGLTYEDSSTNL